MEGIKFHAFAAEEIDTDLLPLRDHTQCNAQAFQNRFLSSELISPVLC